MRRMLRVLQLIMCICTIVSLSACVKRLDTRVVMQPAAHDKFVKINTDVRDVNIHYLEYPGEGGDIVLIPGFDHPYSPGKLWFQNFKNIKRPP